MKSITLLVTALALTLALTGSAFAQGASSDPYVDEGGQVQGQIQDEGTGADQAAANTTSGDTGGSLPFTGLDLSLIAGGGVLLLAAGIAMRRLTPGSRSA
jgi:hypothetical protein